MKPKNRIAILTGGGDCPGINAVIRSVAKKAILEYDMEIVGIKDGYEGVINASYRGLRLDDVSGIITLGGTILGTSNTADPYKYALKKGSELEDVSKIAISNLKELELDCLICIGGDGTLSIANKLFCDGIPIIGVPKTIDNDLRGTDVTFGFESAVSIASEGIDRLHTTAQSHHRVMIIELMGRNAGWITLYSGIASGGDILLIPEIPYDIEKVIEKVKDRHRRGKRYTILVVSEGAKPLGGKQVVQRLIKDSPYPERLGGIGFLLGSQIEEATNIESRTVVMGHLQRSGVPTPFDRVLATRLGCKAVDLIVNKDFGCMVGVRGNSLVNVPLAEVAKGARNISPDDPLVSMARSLGTSFGD